MPPRSQVGRWPRVVVVGDAAVGHRWTVTWMAGPAPKGRGECAIGCGRHVRLMNARPSYRSEDRENKRRTPAVHQVKRRNRR